MIGGPRRCSSSRDIAVKLPRRKFLNLATGAAAVSSMPRMAGAQRYPMRPVRWIVGFPPGGPNDITARIMAEFLSERLHQQFAVENRPGAAGNIATESVARSQPDGYTVMELATVNAINASLYENLNYDFIRDIVLVAGIGQGPAVMEVTYSVCGLAHAAFQHRKRARLGSSHRCSM